LKLSLGANDLRATDTFRFRLSGDGPPHLIRKVYVFNFYCGNLYPPRIGLFINPTLELLVQVITLGQKLEAGQVREGNF